LHKPEDPVPAGGLADRIRRGDRAAETEFAELFGQRVFSLAAIRRYDREAAKDLVQDVLMAVLRALRAGQLQRDGSLGAFVYGTARNLIADGLRDQVRRKESALPEDLAAALPEDGFYKSEQVNLAVTALQHLTPSDRQILSLTLIDGLKPGEVARQVGLSPEVVRARKSRALKKIIAIIRKPLRKGGPVLPIRGDS
jgi:RNA polymerase sigma factor (sigma-70 family)